ncbi:hypothetical protein, partial [Cohnella sp. REN36]
TLRVTGYGQIVKPEANDLAEVLGESGLSKEHAAKEQREVYFGGQHYMVEVYDPTHLSEGQLIYGPAVI